MEPEEALAAAATVLGALRGMPGRASDIDSDGTTTPLPGLRNNET